MTESDSTPSPPPPPLQMDNLPPTAEDKADAAEAAEQMENDSATGVEGAAHAPGERVVPASPLPVPGV